MAETDDRAPRPRRRWGLSRTTKPKILPGEDATSFDARLSMWREGDRAYMRAYNRQRRASDPDYLEGQRARARTWKKDNSEHVRGYRSRYFHLNKAAERLSNIGWLKRNPSAKSRYDARYRERNREKLIAYFRAPENLARRRVVERRRYATEPQNRLAKIIRSTFRQALRLQSVAKRQSVIGLIGCSVEELATHIERQFSARMTWANHSRDGWHIDHIRPCASFDLTDPAQQRARFHFTNLRPLWGVDNRRKSARLELLL